MPVMRFGCERSRRVGRAMIDNDQGVVYRLRNVVPPPAYLSQGGIPAIGGVSTLDSDDIGEFCHEGVVSHKRTSDPLKSTPAASNVALIFASVSGHRVA